eukprot:684060-Amphidinium_carterae.1
MGCHFDAILAEGVWCSTHSITNLWVDIVRSVWADTTLTQEDDDYDDDQRNAQQDRTATMKGGFPVTITCMSVRSHIPHGLDQKPAKPSKLPY